MCRNAKHFHKLLKRIKARVQCHVTVCKRSTRMKDVLDVHRSLSIGNHCSELRLVLSTSCAIRNINSLRQPVRKGSRRFLGLQALRGSPVRLMHTTQIVSFQLSTFTNPNHQIILTVALFCSLIFTRRPFPRPSALKSPFRVIQKPLHWLIPTASSTF